MTPLNWDRYSSLAFFTRLQWTNSSLQTGLSFGEIAIFQQRMMIAELQQSKFRHIITIMTIPHIISATPAKLL